MSPSVESKNPRAPTTFMLVIVLVDRVAQLMLVPVSVETPPDGMVLAAVLLASIKMPVEVCVVAGAHNAGSLIVSGSRQSPSLGSSTSIWMPRLQPSPPGLEAAPMPLAAQTQLQVPAWPTGSLPTQEP